MFLTSVLLTLIAVRSTSSRIACWRSPRSPRLICPVENVPHILFGKETLQNAAISEEHVSKTELLKIRHHEVQVRTGRERQGSLVHPRTKIQYRPGIGKRLMREEDFCLCRQGTGWLRCSADIVA